MSSPNDKVLSYLTAQNRPYSVNDIFLNLHREVGKTAVQKTLDVLVADGKVRLLRGLFPRARLVNQTERLLRINERYRPGEREGQREAEGLRR